jgi:hypothetical protein
VSTPQQVAGLLIALGLGLVLVGVLLCPRAAQRRLSVSPEGADATEVTPAASGSFDTIVPLFRHSWPVRGPLRTSESGS